MYGAEWRNVGRTVRLGQGTEKNISILVEIKLLIWLLIASANILLKIFIFK